MHHIAETKVVLARQPIFDRNNQVVAYELLYRFLGDSQDDGISTVNLLFSSLADIGLFNIIDNKQQAFINFTADDLQYLPVIKDQNIVIEVLEDVKITPQVVATLQRAKKQGYTIALDDFVYSASWVPLLELAHIVKLDVLALSIEELRQHVTILQAYKVQLLAEKIETYEMLELCHNLGFSYFQGYFLSKPNIVTSKRANTNKIVVLQLLQKVYDPNVEFPEIEQILSSDPKLSFKLLKIVNSAAYFKMKNIESIQQAVVYLGIEQLRIWLSVILLLSVAEKPRELLIKTMIRANMCKLLISNKIIRNKFLSSNSSLQASSYFTTGLFSTLDALMDGSMDNLLKDLSLLPEIIEALLYRTGPIGILLSCVIAYENGEWQFLLQQVDRYCRDDYQAGDNNNQKLRKDDVTGVLNSELFLYLISRAYWDSVTWADELLSFII